jgi:hypothetical protein
MQIFIISKTKYPDMSIQFHAKILLIDLLRNFHLVLGKAPAGDFWGSA